MAVVFSLLHIWLRCFFFLFALPDLSSNSHSCSAHSFNRRLLPSPNASAIAGVWSPAGPRGGACGYGEGVEQPPFSSMIAAGGPSLFESGKACGSCYLSLLRRPGDRGDHRRVPGGPCLAESAHFDMSGTAFGAMALPGQSDQLRGAGVLAVQFMRPYSRHVSSLPLYAVQNAAMRGRMSPSRLTPVPTPLPGGAHRVRRRRRRSLRCLPRSVAGLRLVASHGTVMGAVWKINSALALRAPFSFRLTSLTSEKTLVATDVIPAGWQPG
ncbi:unnamed protein product [Spirodela intermedia]|uniref:Uncharacterized protein n=1 Tax=Spirodela intermedia TaxID=51605 RepID=A0A7I8JBE3_SPIIN|nr:unnamed protein product [Spirodela intermedia]CAA6666793.1 unnamed protein product [Spirodela intermedia]